LIGFHYCAIDFKSIFEARVWVFQHISLLSSSYMHVLRGR
jgi:hypothetical protein